jgi:tetratricopeptide (TPR) repeat protein
MSLLLMTLGCALRVAPYQPTQHLPSPALGQVFSQQDPQAVFEEALARRDEGDSRGAIDRLVWLREQGDESPVVLYQLGLAYELAGDFDTALAVYELLDVEDAQDRYELDVGFRRAMCLEALGRWDEALRTYRRLPQTAGFDRHDRLTLDLALGMAELRAGRTRRGQQLLEGALSATANTDEVPWMRAKAWYTLADVELARAGDEGLGGSERRQVRGLEERAAAIALAEQYLVQVVTLEEPEWILAGLLSLGDAYADLREDMLAVPAPSELNEEEALHYRAVLEQRTQVLLRKSYEAYDQGLLIAGKFQIRNEATAQLRQRRDALVL